MSRRIRVSLLALLFPLFLVGLHARTLTYAGDPDRYYHFALSRLLNEKHAFYLNSLPQAAGVGWDIYFPDKEFLFHVLTKLGDRLGGERGVELASLAAAAGGGLVLFWFALGALPVLEAFLCALAAFATHSFAIRMLFVRPHVLAIPLFTLLCAAIARRRPAVAALAAFAFTLAYHAFYLPLLAAALVALLALLEGKRARTELFVLACAVAAPVTVALAVNPYFPSNLLMGALQARVPMLLRGEMSSSGFGLELYPLGGPGLLKFYWFQFLVILAALAAGLYRDFASRFLLAGSLFFGALAFETVRAGEYLVPVSGLLLTLLVGAFRDRRWLYGAAAVQLALLGWIARTEASFVPDGALYDSVKAAIAAIPPGPAKVFNCEWDTAPFLLEARPDLRFVDLLDPSFLREADAKLFFARKELLDGHVADARAMVHAVFEADYVLCRTPGLVGQLAGDPGFDRLYPRTGHDAKISLFRAQPKPDPAFARRLRYRLLETEEALHPRDYVPGRERLTAYPMVDMTVVVGLSGLRSPGTRCVHVDVDPEELAAHRGAAYLGVGGGPAIRAWRSGKLLYASGPEFSRSRAVQALVRLDPPLRAGDRLDLLVCAGPTSSFWTAAVSLWTEKSAREVCRRKAEAQGGPTWPASGAILSSDQETCIGSLAGPAVPGELRP